MLHRSPHWHKGGCHGELSSFLTATGLFFGQSKEFFAFMTDLAEDADEARRDVE